MAHRRNWTWLVPIGRINLLGFDSTWRPKGVAIFIALTAVSFPFSYFDECNHWIHGILVVRAE